MSVAAALTPRLIALQGIGAGSARSAVRFIAVQGLWPDDAGEEPSTGTGSGGWSVRTPSVPVDQLLRLLKARKKRRDRRKRVAEELLLLGVPH